MVLDAGGGGTSCSLFRDSAEVEPPEQTYEAVKDTLNNNYETSTPAPVFKQMLQDEWMPDPNDERADTLAKVKSAEESSARQMLAKKIRGYYPKILALTDSGPVLVVFMIMTLWALLAVDILHVRPDPATHAHTTTTHTHAHCSQAAPSQCRSRVRMRRCHRPRLPRRSLTPISHWSPSSS